MQRLFHWCRAVRRVWDSPDKAAFAAADKQAVERAAGAAENTVQEELRRSWGKTPNRLLRSDRNGYR